MLWWPSWPSAFNFLPERRRTEPPMPVPSRAERFKKRRRKRKNRQARASRRCNRNRA